MSKSLLSLTIAAVVLSGCSLIPDYQRPETPVAAQYPQGPAYEAANAPGQAAAEQGWKQFFHDPTLQQLIQVALENNRDLRVAALNIDAYAAQYRIQRADLFPAVSATGSGSRQRVPARASQSGEAAISSSYSATLGISAYELDLFGRVRSLSEQALQSYFATEEARRSTQISLVANVANAYLTWQADKELLKLTQETLGAYEQSFKLTSRSAEVGVSSALDLSQARTAVENARVQLARYTRQVAQDENSLTLLLGTGLPANLSSQPLNDDLLSEVPAGLPSDLLQRRPDILQAERNLLAANANIGAARAAFFPSISLTANAGTLSPDLSGLFKGGSGTWTFAPQINLPIFNAGSLRASLDYAKIQKDINVAQYEKSIQTAFQEVSDGLAARQTYNEQLQAQTDFVAANQDYYRLAERRYRIGVDSNLTFLDAQRQLFSAQQSLITDRLAQLTSEVNLYKALGGGWNAETGKNEPVKEEAPKMKLF
ncbi:MULTISPECIES: AdeC/AdeK/OprM family multidrug efflux complex outer membrane factor [Pseudomonas]|uniref:Outer membrane protein efflux transporter, outer membrane factor (OMF) lipoprotein, NodT family n=1 Tax=Pseudomonas brassicacearum (strain NFM421) TaxID=994484 RepID=F2KDX9_PSEBN|nr:MULTISPECIES: AdeC/AdeK/OprM family multidrug efflux complex outer membrane factor [Pseudomonas]EIK70434.1 efflux transporter, outer membrane factor lipoprotein EmhC [Pseudomonas fluorescens Q8r1-96]KIR14317.1 putative efflux pump outer membrane protein TtgC precursor [Pseudomonas fluorescens]AEA67456.1 outer membrane protein precursor; efflux transporter, outer membrane factor (OMF) lipoprotein, NodT family [Pseudomonas brassicacearum subsp. brassicacearum NFM421]ALQ02025.1 RND efflux syste